MRWKMIFGIAAVAAFALLETGCLVVEPTETEVDCSCYEVNDCKTFCGPTDCWQECEGTKTCPTNCEDTGQGPGAGSDCRTDGECGKGLVCIDQQCRPRDTNQTGNGGICQTCETAYDCADSSARCVALGDSVADGKVCSPTCQSDTDCPSSFECVDVGDEGTPSQCLPTADSSGQRTCTTPPNGECTSSRDCGAGETCIANQCEPPEDAECSADGDCGDGEVCRDFSCEPEQQSECLTRKDCRSDEQCIDGKCESRNPSDGCILNKECNEGNAEGDTDAICVDGQCLSKCQDRGDCNAREYCRKTQGSDDGICEPIECRTNPDCPAGQICVEARCEDACKTNSDCMSGYVCSDTGYCEPDPDVDCRSNAECARDEMCQQGSCVKPCDCNQQCPSGEVCNNETGLCSNPDQPKDECTDDCDCPSGESCNSGTCG